MDSVRQKRWSDHPEVKFDWEILVSEGHVWIARMNRLLKRTPFWLTCIFLALLSHDVVSSTALLGSRLTSYQSEDAAPGAFQKMVFSPFNTVRGAITASPAQLLAESPRPTLDQAKFKMLNNFALAPFIKLDQSDRPALGLIVEKMRAPGGQNTAWIKEIVRVELEALNASGKLAAIPMEPFPNLGAEWYKSVEQTSAPVSKVGQGGVVWIGSVIMDNDGKIRPQLGVFRRTAAGYEYFNVRLNEQFATLSNYPVVTEADIPRQIGADFPDVIMAPDQATHSEGK
jgi:hypothetical protein